MTINKIEKPIHREIPIGWITKKVSQVFDFLSTNSFSRNQMNYKEKEDSIYNIHYGDIHATYTEPILDLEKCKDVPVINEDVVIPTSASFLKDGDLVMADASEDYAGVGETVELVNIGNKKVLAGLHTFALRDKNGTTAKGFRTYIFKHPKVATSVKVIATGSKVYGISKTNLANVKVILPPLPEQQKIATILSTWDKAIDKLTQLIAAKEQRKKGLMQQLLTGKKRFEGFTDEWKEVKLETVAKFKNGKGHENDVNENGEYVLVNSKFVASEGKEYKMVSEAHELLKKGTIVMVMSDVPNGKALAKCYLINEDNKFTLNQRICSLTPKGINTYFLLYQLNRNKFYMKFDGGVGQTNLKKQEVLNCPVLLPNKEEQQKIAIVLTAADKEIELLKNELESLQQQKKGLMQVLLTGALRVPLV